MLRALPHRVGWNVFIVVLCYESILQLHQPEPRSLLNRGSFVSCVGRASQRKCSTSWATCCLRSSACPPPWPSRRSTDGAAWTERRHQRTRKDTFPLPPTKHVSIFAFFKARFSYFPHLPIQWGPMINTLPLDAKRVLNPLKGAQLCCKCLFLQQDRRPWLPGAAAEMIFSCLQGVVMVGTFMALWRPWRNSTFVL